MEVSYKQLVLAGMTKQKELMFLFGGVEWAMLGKQAAV